LIVFTDKDRRIKVKNKRNMTMAIKSISLLTLEFDGILTREMIDKIITVHGSCRVYIPNMKKDIEYGLTSKQIIEKLEARYR
jgi:hypothetical protein